MTSGLRKAHKYIWLLLVVVVPVIMVFAIKDLDVFSSENNASQLNESKKTSIKSFENDIIKADLYESHIEIILKSTLKNSSSVVYEMNNEGNKSKVLGQLTSAGIYKFNVNSLPKGIIISDDLKKVDITKFSFKWD